MQNQYLAAQIKIRGSESRALRARARRAIKLSPPQNLRTLYHATVVAFVECSINVLAICLLLFTDCKAVGRANVTGRIAA